MLTRRTFLAASAATLPAAAASIPEPITALRDRHGEAAPITADERLSRMERARALMATNHMGAVFLAGGTSLTYFSGIRWYNSERLFVMLLPSRGDPLFICPAFEEGRVREQLAQHANLRGAGVFSWQEDDDPYTLAASCLKERGLASARIGFEERMPFVFTAGIAAAATAATFTSATPVTAGCRMIKSPAELALMKLASSVTWHVYEAAWRSIREGMVDRELRELIAAAYERVGFPGEAMVNVNESSALPHGSARTQTIREGSIVLLDDGCSVEGYQSDITRTFVFGRATDKMKRVFDLVRRAQNAALAAARPGRSCGSVDAAARSVIIDGGYGPGYLYFAHRVGHGIGMDGHEWPYLVRGNTLPLAAGMTFSDEPGIYMPGEFGIRLEDDMHITAAGAEMLSQQSNSLEEPFAT